MSVLKKTKINRLISTVPPGSVLLSSWMAAQGYSHGLQKRYRKTHWLESIGKGAMIRTEDQVGYEGAIYALQSQSDSHIHPGGRTALSLLGRAHYLELGTEKVTIFGGIDERLPVWFEKHDWGVTIDYRATSLLPPEMGLAEIQLKNLTIKISGAARAMLECLYLVPREQLLMECYELMEGLNNLRPGQVQELLEACQSVKVKRLFLYLADKAGHEWIHGLDMQKIELGRGKRSIVKNGVYVGKYQIVVPRELEAHERQNI